MPQHVGVGVQRQGAFADYIALPAVNAFKLPDAIPDDVPRSPTLGNAVHMALTFDLVGEDAHHRRPIGLMAAAVARFVGAARRRHRREPGRLAMAPAIRAPSTSRGAAWCGRT